MRSRGAVGNRLTHNPEDRGPQAVEQGDVVGWLNDLRVEHRDLDDVIRHLIDAGHVDTMQIQRLKKRKLKLKETIAKLESELIPNLDA